MAIADPKPRHLKSSGWETKSETDEKNFKEDRPWGIIQDIERLKPAGSHHRHGAGFLFVDWTGSNDGLIASY